MPKERNDGKRLEQLVAMVEGMKLPEGFRVTSNESIRDDNGAQIAELDIAITGRIGSTTYTTIFECRDRPSEGAAPASWIEQLDSRRRRLKLDKIIAVSSTGFSPAAIDWARDSNIPLRTLETLTESDVRGFLPQRAPLLNTHGDLLHVELVSVAEDAPIGWHESVDSQPIESPLKTTDKRLLKVSTESTYTLIEVWTEFLRDHHDLVFCDVPLTGDSIAKTLEAPASFCNAYRLIVSEGERARVERLVFTAKVRQRPSQMPLVEAVEYRGGNPTSVIARWKGDGENVSEIIVILSRDENKT